MADQQSNFVLEDNEPITLMRFQQVYDQLMGKTWVYKGQNFNLKHLGWTWGYSKRKKSLGTAHLSRKRITISKVLLERNLQTNPKAFEDTIRHEIAHAIDYIIRGKSDHSYAWQRVAVALGAIAKRGTKKIESVPYKWTGTCPNCSKVVKRHKLTRSSKGGACHTCVAEHNNGQWTPEYKLEWTQNF